MTLPNVALGDPHVSAHNDERTAINALQDLSDPVFTAGLTATIGSEVETDGTPARTALNAAIGDLDDYATPVIPTRRMRYPHLSKWGASLDRVLTGAGPAKVLVLGDSTSDEHFGNTSNPFVSDSWPSQLVPLLDRGLARAAFGLATPPGNSAGSPGDSRWTLGAGWAWRFAGNVQEAHMGFGGKGAVIRCSNTETGDLVFADPRVTADTFDVYILETNGATSTNYSVQATGGTAVTGVTNGASAKGWRRVTVTSGSLGTGNAVTIKRTAGSLLWVAGVEAYDSTRPSIRVASAGLSGSDTAGWVQYPLGNAADTWNSMAMIKAYGPDLTIIDLGINDAGLVTPTSVADYIDNIQTLIAAAKLSGDVIIKTFVPTDGRQAKQAEYAAALRELDVPIIDTFEHYGTHAKMDSLGWMADTLHPTATGHAAEARAIARTLTSLPRPAAPSTEVVTLGNGTVVRSGTAVSPEFTHADPRGSLYLAQSDGSTTGYPWVKTTAAGVNTGWAPVGTVLPTVDKSANYTLTVNDCAVIFTGSGTLTATLPAASGVTIGRSFRVVNRTSNALTVAPASGTIDGGASISVPAGGKVLVTAYGSSWFTTG